MKRILFLTFLIPLIAFSQQSYYNNVDLSLSDQDLYFELQTKLNVVSSSFTYGDIRDTVMITDEDPMNGNNLFLLYGYGDNGNCTTDKSRDKDDFGGLACEYNREHVFARSNANPKMGNIDNGTTGIGADPHNLRPSSQQMNNNKGSKKFAAGMGNAGDVGSGNWYPGDEWKGDVARTMMYMYTRYGDRCLPSLNGLGATQGSTEMLQLFLQWNAEDPVSDFEDQRNPYLELVYGNRNPFVDNPYLATIIWGGPAAEDRWAFQEVTENEFSSVLLVSNPTSESIQFTANNSFAAQALLVYDISGKVILKKDLNPTETAIDVAGLDNGTYLFQFNSSEKKVTKKIIIQ